MDKNTQLTQSKINVKKITLAACIGILVTLLVLFVAALFLNAGKIPHKGEGIVASVALLLGSIVAGIVSSKKSAAPKILSAGLSGLIIFACCAICGMAILGSNILCLRTIINLVTIFIGVLCGSIVTSTGGGKRKRKR